MFKTNAASSNFEFRAADKWSYATEESSNRSRKSLRTSLQRLLTSNEILPYETEIGRLVDEHAQSLFVRFASRMIEVVEFLRESVRKDDLMPAVSIVVTIGLIVIGGYIMNFLVKREEESVQRQLGAKGAQESSRASSSFVELVELLINRFLMFSPLFRIEG
jgi:hypothetical protein